MAQYNLANETRMIAVSQAQALTTSADYYTVAGFASLHRRRLTPKQANVAGRRATALSKQLDYAVDKIHDARYGQVNQYHQDVLRRVFQLS